jgi:chemotaxis protein CheX
MITETDLAEIVESAAALMLGLYLGELVVEPADIGFSFCASVQLIGNWEGAVVVACDEPFARQTAAAMFGSSAIALTDEEMSDAIGELANTIAGNVKPLLEGASSISLPTVAYGSCLRLEVPGSVCRVRAAYRRDDFVMTVRIYERAVEEAVS